MSRYTRLQAKRQKILDTIHAAKKPTDRMWKLYNRYDKALFHMDQKAWLKTYLKEQRQWLPYGAFYWIPDTMFRMIERCYIYWTHGYDVHVVEEEVAPIRESVTKAYNMVQELKSIMQKVDDGEFNLYPKYQALLAELFTFVGQNCDRWDD